MVRSNQPLVERMTLIWHDWFATADVGQVALNLKQNELFRKRGLGSFEDLLLAVTKDPAMLVWLSGNENEAEAPNENYGRELMELFTLGASNGYTEDDVREQARALTGWTNDWDDDLGMINFRFEPDRHDDGRKRIFGKTGNFDWQDSCRLCLEHPAHAGYFIERLWSYFVPAPPPKRTLAALKKRYRRDRSIRRVVEAILMHPAVYEGPRMVKPPIVQIAGMLRARRSGIDDRRLDLDRRRGRAAPVRARRTSPAGTSSAGSTPPGSAAAGRPRRTIDATRPRRTPRTTTRRRPPPRPSARRSGSGATPRSPTGRRRSCSGSPAASRPSRPPTGSRRPTGRCARTRCGS